MVCCLESDRHIVWFNLFVIQGMILIVFRLASCGSDKMIKLWGREGDVYFILELIELLKFVYRRTKLGV